MLPVHEAGASTGAGQSAGIRLAFRAVDEPEPGEQWLAAFTQMWPAYRAWYLKEGESARLSLRICRRMLGKWMPELLPTFQRLVELAGNNRIAARFLSMYRPPGYVIGCSQAAFTGEGGPVLARNYDYPAGRAEGIVYSTAWTGRRVIGMSDCLWGLLDGVNDAGLTMALTFGGRPTVGDGFGIPLVIRYLLEVCTTVGEACDVLTRMPIHAAQNVTMLDRNGDLATVHLSPDRQPELLNVPVAANHQRREDWPQYAVAVGTFERERRLLELVRAPKMNAGRLVDAFLSPPLYRTEFATGIGTLYTAAYFPAEGRVECRWPGHSIVQSFERFAHQRHTQHYPDPRPLAG
jgi:predicted choloylglycine hydrolase